MAVFQHSKVSVNEPASMGTLLELGNCAFDILRYLVHEEKASLPNPASKLDSKEKSNTLAPSSSFNRKPYMISARYVLETVLMYTTTQLAMWLIKHDNESGGDVELEDATQLIETGGGDKDRERNQRKKSTTLADRLRRGMTGELTTDLQALLAKAQPVMLLSGEVLGGKQEDLTPVLLEFVDKRIATLTSKN